MLTATETPAATEIPSLSPSPSPPTAAADVSGIAVLSTGEMVTLTPVSLLSDTQVPTGMQFVLTTGSVVAGGAAQPMTVTVRWADEQSAVVVWALPVDLAAGWERVAPMVDEGAGGASFVLDARKRYGVGRMAADTGPVPPVL